MDEFLQGLAPAGGSLVVLAAALLLLVAVCGCRSRSSRNPRNSSSSGWGVCNRSSAPASTSSCRFWTGSRIGCRSWNGSLPTASQDAITLDNVLVRVDTSVFYRILEPEKTVYRIRDVDGAIATTVAGIVRAEIGKMELDQVQSNRSALIATIKESVEDAVEAWGIEVTRAEILDVNLDEATREAMLQQLNAERARRARVTEAEGLKRAVELEADAELYAAEQAAKARRVTADAEAYATRQVADAIAENGLPAAQYNVALKQVEALTKVAQGQGQQTVILPANALDAFSDAFKLMTGKGRA
jgi:regulator of protease activity HflC (stomatin/prohibitin superfamily)